LTPTRRYVVSLVCVFVLAATSLAGIVFLGIRPKLGLDLRGGLSVVLTAQGKVDKGRLDETVNIISNRVNSLGAQEPDISRAGSNNIIVQLPGIKDPQRALQIIGTTAQLRFREVLGTVPIDQYQAQALKAGKQPGTPAYDDYVNGLLQKAGAGITPGDPLNQQVTFPSKDGKTLYRLGPAEVVGTDVADAYASFDQTQGGWLVNLRFTGKGTTKFAAITTRLAGKGSLAIVLDRRVESAPSVRQAITNGSGVITGSFTETQAKDLALVLKTGALPVSLEQSQVQQVSPTLGSASLRAGLIAGIIGLAAVAIYMILFYRLLGALTLLGLGVFSCFIGGLIGVLGVTRGFALTLAGIAGLIVSVGIAADSYIIYFERVKDELKEGKSFRSAVERAFRSALSTNIAANSVAFAAAMILWLFAVGPVKGFALTLGISVVIDIGVLYFYTHSVVALVARNRRLTGLRIVGMREVVAGAEGVAAQ
jgi:protein-export membrane protein SecD